MLRDLKTSLLALLWLSLLTGVVYPLAVTGIAQLAFPSQANGSLVVVGSMLKCVSSIHPTKKMRSDRSFTI